MLQFFFKFRKNTLYYMQLVKIAKYNIGRFRLKKRHISKMQIASTDSG